MDGIIACTPVGRKRALVVRTQKTPENPGLFASMEAEVGIEPAYTDLQSAA